MPYVRVGSAQSGSSGAPQGGILAGLVTPIGASNWAVVTRSTLVMFSSYRNNNNGQNSYIEYDIALAAGTYSFEFVHMRTANNGIYHVTIDGAAPTTYGGDADTFDGYAASDTADVRSTITGVVLPTAKTYRVRLTIASKNASSGNYGARLQGLAWSKTA